MDTLGHFARDHPVILGSGVGGLAISRQLSSDGIPHLLISSGEPGLRPRLGESMNGEGTVDLLDDFSEYSRFFTPKDALVLHLGELVAYCDFNARASKPVASLLRLVGLPVFDKLLHLERVGFDMALYRDVVGHKNCRELRTRVRHIEYDSRTDRVHRIRLEDGRELQPYFIFDATNHVSLVARGIGLQRTELALPQHVTFAHYRAPRAGKLDEPWMRCTTLMVLDRERDGMSGMAWCIPLGGYTSIGVSQDASMQFVTGQEALDLTRNAFLKRGLDYSAAYPNISEILDVPNTYYAYDRACGENWLLSAGAFSQVWFSAGSGLSMALAASKLATKILSGSQLARRQYERFLRSYLPTHSLHENLRRSTETRIGRKKVQETVDQLVESTLARLCSYAGARNGRMSKVFGLMFAAFFRAGVFKVKGHCSSDEVQPGGQSEWVREVHGLEK